ncbi:MAG: Abi family protein [Bacteroidales bacterium]|nr:Abi family protein [Bacteroidales bacterium]
MEYNRHFFEKNFSSERMKKYDSLYPTNWSRVVEHYKCNMMLSESLYLCLSVFEVALRNALVRELKKACGNNQWYSMFDDASSLQFITTPLSRSTPNPYWRWWRQGL